MTNLKKYHHGDLHSTLLTEARALLAQSGVDGLSLRKLADRAGVSRQAPYHHFKDKHVLLCSLAAEGFRELDALLARTNTEEEVESTLATLLRAYLRFACDDPERYELMFGRRIWKMSEPTPELKQLAYATFKRYVSVIKAICRANDRDFEPRRALRIAQASWATLHGLSHLTNDGIYVDLEGMEDASDVALEMLLKSIKSPK